MAAKSIIKLEKKEKTGRVVSSLCFENAFPVDERCVSIPPLITIFGFQESSGKTQETWFQLGYSDTESIYTILNGNHDNLSDGTILFQKSQKRGCASIGEEIAGFEFAITKRIVNGESQYEFSIEQSHEKDAEPYVKTTFCVDRTTVLHIAESLMREFSEYLDTYNRVWDREKKEMEQERPVTVKMTLPQRCLTELNNLAREFSQEEDKTVTVDDLIKRAIQKEYDLA